MIDGRTKGMNETNALFSSAGGTDDLTRQIERLTAEKDALVAEFQRVNADLRDELPGLRDANAALRRDNDDLTRQKDRLIAENLRLREAATNYLKIAGGNGGAADYPAGRIDGVAVFDGPLTDAQRTYLAGSPRRQRGPALRQRNASLEKDAYLRPMTEAEARLRDALARDEDVTDLVRAVEDERSNAACRTSNGKQNVDDQARLMRLTLDSGAQQQVQIDTLIRVLGRVVR